MFHRGLPVVLSLTLACHFAEAGTIVVSITAPGPSIGGVIGPFQGLGYGGQALGESWTTSETYSNIAISATLWLSDTSVASSYDVDAYLTTSIGPGTTAALASTSFTASNTSPEAFELFSGLTLGPGTYYLTLADPDPVPDSQILQPHVFYSWANVFPGAPGFQQVTAPGVTTQGYIFDGFSPYFDLDYAFPPASTNSFPGAAEYFEYSVVSVPEASTVWLFGIGFLAVGLAKMRYRRGSTIGYRMGSARLFSRWFGNSAAHT